MRAALLVFAPPIGADVGDDESWFEKFDDVTLGPLLTSALILAIAIIVTFVLGKVMRRAVRRGLHIVGRQLDVDRVRSDAREKAIASALWSAIVGVIWVVAVITIIGELGVNIGGVLAAATVVGGAVAFGAQSLIRDVIAGLFVLVEDQYGVGDEVDLGIAKGTVQKITLRTVRLRDSEGRVWHVQHGNILRVADLSAASLAVIDIEVDRAMPLDEVEMMAEELRVALEQDPATAPLLSATPKKVGIGGIKDDRLVYRLIAATYPGRQAEVQRRWTALAVEVFQRATHDDTDAVSLLRGVQVSSVNNDPA